MKKILLIFLCIFTSINVYSFSIDVPEFNGVNYGTCKTLNSRNTLIYTIYVSQDGYPMTQADMDKYNIAVHAAGDWIMSCCKQHGIEHTFKYARRRGGVYKLKSDVNICKTPTRKLIEMVFGVHYRDTLNRIRTRDLGYHDNVIISFCTTIDSCSYAYQDNMDLYRKNHYDYPEGVIINSKGPGYLESIIAHELLHCYGAWDLYERSDVMFYTGKAAPYKKYMENSIMCKTNRPLKDLRIDELTMYLTGICKKTYDWFSYIMACKVKKN